VDELSSTTGIVALAAAGVALVALVVAIVLAFRLRRVRSAQRAVLGDMGARDLVGHAADITEQFRGLHDWVEDVANKLHQRMDLAEDRLDGTIAYRALVRYDAYGEMSGRQSTSIALLDARRSGIVLSAIHHRDQARLYAKQVVNGEGETELSPEEAEAVRQALSAPPAEPATERA
jgi:Protein of unknown function (DUF4446)